MLRFGKLFLVYYWEDRDSTKFPNSKEEYKTLLLKLALEQFEAKVYSNFQQVAHV